MKLKSLCAAFLTAAVSLQASELDNIQADFGQKDPDFGFNDRGEMYLRTYNATDSKAAVVEGNISTFSGFVGGTAYLANYVLARLRAATMNIDSLWKEMLETANNQKICVGAL